MDTTDEFRQRLVDSNINEETFLATDYLNHFNEVVMLVEMIPSMPECIEDICQWEPKSYEEHFAESGFSDKTLAIEAYHRAPAPLKKRFDETISKLDSGIISAIESLKETYEMEIPEYLTILCEKLTVELRHNIDVASALINGHGTLDSPTVENDSVEKTQAAVEELFAD